MVKYQLVLKIVAFVIVITMVSASSKHYQERDQSRENWHERSPTTINISNIPILGTVYDSFNKIVAELSGRLVDYSDKLSEVIERPAAAVVNSVNQNIEAIANSSNIFRRDLSEQNETKIVKDNKYYANKYAGKYINKFGKKAGVKREVTTSQNELNDLKSKILELKDSAEDELTIAVKKYGNELNKVSGDFIEKNAELGQAFKMQFKGLTNEFLKETKNSSDKKITEKNWLDEHF